MNYFISSANKEQKKSKKLTCKDYAILLHMRYKFCKRLRNRGMGFNDMHWGIGLGWAANSACAMAWGAFSTCAVAGVSGVGGSRARGGVIYFVTTRFKALAKALRMAFRSRSFSMI